MQLSKVKRVISSVLGELPVKEGGGSFKPQAYKRETQTGEVPENTGFVESPTAAELKIKMNAALDPSDFRDVSSDTLTIFLAGGGQHVMPNAWVTDAVELGAGEMEVTYNSAKSEKLN